MNLPPLLAAVARGDDRTVFDLLDDVPDEELTGDDGVALLAAAAYAGRDEVVWRLVEAGVDVTRPWAGGVDPVTWAAGRGAYPVLLALLIRSGDPLDADSPHRRALRVARAGIASGAAGEEPGPPPAHWAIVSRLEAELGVHRSPDELMARALVHARPDHDDWSESLLQLGYRADQEVFTWARDVASDRSSRDRRRFGLGVLNFIGFGLDSPYDLDLHRKDDEQLPFTREAAEFLRPLLDTEQDSHALRSVIAAFASYCSAQEAKAVLVHAGHADPGVRRCVASPLANNSLLVTADHPDVLDALARLAEDPVPDIRVTALCGLAMSHVDTAELRALLAAHLADPHFDARLEAAAGLALRGDERGHRVLDEVRPGIKNHRSRGAGRLGDLHHMMRARTATAVGVSQDREAANRTVGVGP
ncbi:hypothetical protein ACFCYI_19070 [Streptomyces sp. NPDC056257]|uniref:hypothetical protein n=1 Tax=Streptomyces sp. NPDC056257 TaxID=3345765 RepID=UPI0035DDA666